MKKFLVNFNQSQASFSSNVNPSHFIDDLNLDSLEADPGKRVPIAHYNPRIKDEVRKYYIQKGPCQPKMDSYPPTEI